MFIFAKMKITFAETNPIKFNPYYIMKKNRLPIVGKIQDINDEANDLFRDEVMMPMVTFAVTILVFVVLVDYSFQLIEAIDILAL